MESRKRKNLKELVSVLHESPGGSVLLRCFGAPDVFQMCFRHVSDMLDIKDNLPIQTVLLVQTIRLKSTEPGSV